MGELVDILPSAASPDEGSATLNGHAGGGAGAGRNVPAPYRVPVQIRWVLSAVLRRSVAQNLPAGADVAQELSAAGSGSGVS
jgi:hypothetical protein